MNLMALRQKYATQKKSLQSILDAAAAEGHSDLNLVEGRKYDAGLQALHSLEATLREAESELETQRRSLDDGAVNVITGEHAGATARALRSPAGLRPLEGRRYRDLFGAVDSAGFKSFNEYVRTIHSGLADPRMQAVAQGMGENVPSDGGFLVPTEFAAELLDVALENEIVRPRAQVYPMKSATKMIAGLDDLDNSGAAPYGGLSIQWANEGDTGSNKKAKTRLIELHAQKAMIFAFSSNELIADGMNFDELIGSAIVKSLGWGLDRAFLVGNGAGQPVGVFNDPALIVVAKETNQLANTLLYQNVINMFSRLHPACMMNSAWLANPTTLPQLLAMQLVVKNVAGTENVGGSATPVFAADGKGGFTLLTRPVIFTEKVPALSAQGDILLADFSQYAIGLRKEVSLERSIYAGWQTDESGYRAIVRVDGQGKWRAAFKPLNGSTLSWCVTLAAR